jgi:endogenous inhibitor of DNA gyrase (YacG/DUF329 family)
MNAEVKISVEVSFSRETIELLKSLITPGLNGKQIKPDVIKLEGHLPARDHTHWYTAKPKKCKTCGKEYQTKSNGSKFCSRECHLAPLRKQKPATIDDTMKEIEKAKALREREPYTFNG